MRNTATIIGQGYRAFHFSIPQSALIDGIQVQVEAHGDDVYSVFFLDRIGVNVHYSLLGC